MIKASNMYEMDFFNGLKTIKIIAAIHNFPKTKFLA
jgi:hypothetical protein